MSERQDRMLIAAADMESVVLWLQRMSDHDRIEMAAGYVREQIAKLNAARTILIQASVAVRDLASYDSELAENGRDDCCQWCGVHRDEGHGGEQFPHDPDCHVLEARRLSGVQVKGAAREGAE